MLLPLTTKNILLTVKEFLIVWLNQILYFNKVYDQHIFDRFKSFEHVVYKNRNPNFNQYADQLITNMFTNVLFNGSGLQCLVCLIFDDRNQSVLRKYAINFTDIITNIRDTITPAGLDTSKKDTSSILEIPGLEWADIYTQFSSTLFQHIQELKRLNVEDENNLFFSIVVEAQDSVSLTTSNWVRLSDANSEVSKPRKVVSIGDVSLHLLNFDIINEYFK